MDNATQIERYLLGGLSLKDREDFEQRLSNDLDLQEELRSYRILFYVENKLSKTEKEKFKNDLISDVNLQEDVRLQKLANDVIQGSFHQESNVNGWESYKEMIKDFPKEQNGSISKIIPLNNDSITKKQSSIFSKFVKIAAVVTFLFIGSFLLIGYNIVSVSNQELAESGVKDTKLIGVSRSSDNSVESLESLSAKLDKAETLLKSYEYDEAIPLLEAAKYQADAEGSDKLLEIQYALATAYLGVNKTDKAINEYEEITSFDKRQKQIIKKAQQNSFILKIKKALGLEN